MWKTFESYEIITKTQKEAAMHNLKSFNKY